MLGEERPRSQEHSRSAEAALGRPVTHERELERIGHAVGVEPLDGQERATIHAGGQDEASANRFAVEEHGAGAAHAFPAAELRAVQGETVPQEVDHRPVARRLGAARPSVQRERERHAALSTARRTRAANPPASSAALTFITASPTEPSLPRTFTSLR